MPTLYRNTAFAHLTGNREVEVMTDSALACVRRAQWLEAKGFATRIEGLSQEDQQAIAEELADKAARRLAARKGA